MDYGADKAFDLLNQNFNIVVLDINQNVLASSKFGEGAYSFTIEGNLRCRTTLEVHETGSPDYCLILEGNKVIAEGKVDAAILKFPQNLTKGQLLMFDFTMSLPTRPKAPSTR